MVDPIVHTALRAGLALLFAMAALHKLRDAASFRATLAEYRMVPQALVRATATIVIAVEVVVAVAVLRPGTYAAAGVAAAVLLCVYSVAIATNLARGRRHIDCGCLGPSSGQGLTPWLLIRNAALVAGSAAVLLPTTGRELIWIDAVTLAGTLIVLGLLWVSGTRLAVHAALGAGTRRSS